MPTGWWLPWLLFIRVVSGFQCETTESTYDYELRGHTIREMTIADLGQCITRCQEEFYCLSINYRRTDKMCFLKRSDRHTHGTDYGPSDGYIYMDNLTPYLEDTFQSCAQLKKSHPSFPSGHYRMTMTTDRQLTVYCDMDNFGGGWTLVVTISSSDNKHLQQPQNNCLNSMLCVPFINDTIPGRKLSDQDIHKLAASEGTFRVQLIHPGNTYDVFHQIPSGQRNFDSSCLNGTCPRIIVSHSYPYVWEANCKGTSVGYKIYPSTCHRVFDDHDNSECGGNAWMSSLYSSKRVLYGYPCPALPEHNSLGLYKNQQGMMFVR